MALQGSIETFALPDVLRLLASTNKTGRLRLSGTGGSGSLWVAEGKLVAGDTTTSSLAGSPTQVLFELLRFPDGDFVFDQDETHDGPGDPTEAEEALTEAEAMLGEYKELEAVVPSLDAWVSLRSEIDGDEIMVTAEQWRSVALIGGGLRASEFGTKLELSEIDIMRQVSALVSAGMVEVGDAPAQAPAPAPAPVAAAAPEPQPEPQPEPEPEPTPEPAPAAQEAAEPPAVDAGFEPFDASALVVESPAPAAEATPAAEPEPTPASDEPEMDAADIARQLATLSPAAARAVAAAAKARTPEERDEALAGIPEGEGSLNRDVLLKFLGSVNS